MTRWLSIALLVAVATPALAQEATKPDSSQPVEIASDTLEVLQSEHKAIFKGNVIAKQGDTTMRAAVMTVFYTEKSSGTEPEAAPVAAADAPSSQGIERIESEGDVVFTTPEETAQGDKAIYNVVTDTIDLTGNVVLTQKENVLKGSALNYNLKTGRSMLTAGNNGRVRGLFVPGKDSQP